MSEPASTVRVRVMYVVGTRPELIRSAHILAELRARPDVDLAVVHTGQHYDHAMSGGFLEELELPAPTAFLGCGGRPRAEQVAAVVQGTAEAIRARRPACVCVFGDTNTALAAALAATSTDTPVVHIEAGARSHDMSMPEEVNRRLIDHMGDLLLAVSRRCVANLRRESVPGTVVDTGDPLFDVFERNFAVGGFPAVSTQSGRRTCLMTLHRQALVDDWAQLSEVLTGVSEFADSAGVEVVFPVHPRTRATLRAHAGMQLGNIAPCEPLRYQDLLATLGRCSLVITDSGGLQKEAFWASKPCVTVRTVTEWGETVDAGANVLAQGKGVAAAAARMIDMPARHHLDDGADPYHGAGSSRRVAEAIIERYAH